MWFFFHKFDYATKQNKKKTPKCFKLTKMGFELFLCFKGNDEQLITNYYILTHNNVN